jgi:hypothetical protein
MFDSQQEGGAMYSSATVARQAAIQLAAYNVVEERRLLICYAVWLLNEPTIRRNFSPPSSGLQDFIFLRSVGRLLVTADVRSTESCLPDDGGAKFPRLVGSYESHTASHPRRRHSSMSLS